MSPLAANVLTPEHPFVAAVERALHEAYGERLAVASCWGASRLEWPALVPGSQT